MICLWMILEQFLRLRLRKKTLHWMLSNSETASLFSNWCSVTHTKAISLKEKIFLQRI